MFKRASEEATATPLPLAAVTSNRILCRSARRGWGTRFSGRVPEDPSRLPAKPPGNPQRAQAHSQSCRDEIARLGDWGHRLIRPAKGRIIGAWLTIGVTAGKELQVQAWSPIIRNHPRRTAIQP